MHREWKRQSGWSFSEAKRTRGFVGADFSIKAVRHAKTDTNNMQSSKGAYLEYSNIEADGAALHMTNDTWSNGVYTITSTGSGSGAGLDGWDNSGFKFNSTPITLTPPSYAKVKQLIIKDYANGYAVAGEKDHIVSVTSTSATVYLPTKNYCMNASV